MALETRIPKEITEYREKVLFGLSLRQLICFSLAMVLCGTTYFLMTYMLHLNKDLVGYIVIFEAVPLLAVGFVRVNGFTFEKYFVMLVNHKTRLQRRTYQTELTIDKYIEKTSKKVGKYDWIFQKEDGIGKDTFTSSTKQERKQDAQKREFEVFTLTKEGRKKQSSITKRKIENARKECRTAKQRVTKAS
jgi:hypothetical protein